MSRRIDRETILNFAGEVEEYLPTIRQGIDAYAADSRQAEALYESFRLTHSIKGGAALIGLSLLSHVIFRVEETLEKVIQEKQPIESPTRDLLHQVLDLIAASVRRLVDGDSDQVSLLEDATRLFRRHLGLPEEEDRREVERVLQETRVASSDSSSTRASKHDDEVAHFVAFREEAEDHLGVIAGLLRKYAENVDDVNSLVETRRRVHSLKGAAGALGVHAIAKLGHRMEDLLDRSLADETPRNSAVADLYLQTVDMLEDLVREKANPERLKTLLSHYAETLGISDEGETSANAPVDLPADVSLDDAGTISAELLDVFKEESEDHLKSIYAALEKVTRQPDNAELIQELRRPAHTLKGAAGAVGLQVVTKLAHRMEDLLDKLYDGTSVVTPDLTKLLYGTADMLTELSEGKYDKHVVRPVLAQLFAEYDQRLGKVNAPVETRETLDVEVIEEIHAPKPAPRKGQAAPAKQGSEQMLRVPLDRLDDLVRVVSELIVNRSAFEQRMGSFLRYVEDLQTTVDRLRVVSYELETRYGVNLLGSKRLMGGDGESSSWNSTGSRSRVDEFDSLEFDRYTGFHLVSRTLAESTADINTLCGELRILIGDFDSLLNRQGRLSRDAQDRLMHIRMVPVATLTTRLHRVVRGVAREQDKQIELVIDGEYIELDKTVLEEMADPLLHILRNAADHGVEPPALRLAKGKPPQARIKVEAYYQGTQVVIRVSDDGCGIDPDRLRRAAVEKGFLGSADAESLTNDEAVQLIFLPGFSTAQKISEISGRGVGMDIVRHKVHQLKGTVAVESTLEQGTTFTIRLPMTLAVTRALLVHSRTETFAIPMQSVTQILRLDRGGIEKLGREQVIRINGRAYPVVDLAKKLNLQGIDDPTRTTQPVLILDTGESKVALSVDRVLGGRDIVVKTLGSHLRRVRGIIGATLMGDGTVVPILDPTDFGKDGQAREIIRRKPTQAQAGTAAGNLTVMIVDDSVSVRRVMTNLVKGAGWTPISAKDGVDALEILHNTKTIPDVFLLDIEMPRMDGYELLSTLRGQGEFNRTPIVMVTSRAGNKHRDKAMAMGASGYVIKPYQDDELLGLIRQLVGQTREIVLS